MDLCKSCRYAGITEHGRTLLTFPDGKQVLLNRKEWHYTCSCPYRIRTVTLGSGKEKCSGYISDDKK